MNFSEIIVTLVLVSGMISLIDMLPWKQQKIGKQKRSIIIEYARSFFPIMLLILVIRSFIVEPFRIPSASMLPTLHIGDFILVNKFPYGIRLPVLNYKVFDVGHPKRGDVLVFRFPKNPRINYIKRVIGLPGDKIGYFNKTIFINGNDVKQNPRIKDGNLLELLKGKSELLFQHLGATGHDILILPGRRLVEGEIIVPDGHYFVMGDNRDNSSDSRFWGTVPKENLVGKALFIWMSWDWNLGGIVWSRLARPID